MPTMQHVCIKQNYLYYSLLDRLLWGRNGIPDELYGKTKLLVKDYFSLLYGLENCIDISLGLPCWLIGKESTCQCRRPGFNPWSRKNPHATEQISLGATTIEPVLQSLRATTTEPSSCNYRSLKTLEPMLSTKRSRYSEKPTRCNQRLAPTCCNEDPAQPNKQRKILNFPLNQNAVIQIVWQLPRVKQMFIK